MLFMCKCNCTKRDRTVATSCNHKSKLFLRVATNWHYSLDHSFTRADMQLKKKRNALHLPAQGNPTRLAAGAVVVADGGVEPEELERAPAALAGGGRLPVPAAARGEVPHELLEAPAHAAAVLARRSFLARFAGAVGGGEDAIQEDHGVAELPVHVLGRALPLPPLFSLSGKAKC
jgi:hypothetical protein